MPTHAEKRVLPHSPEQLFALVADIEKYPEFLPWCVATRVRERTLNEDGDTAIADMVIGYKVFRETFTSKVVTRPPGRIDVSYSKGPFRYLNNHWIFEPVSGEGGRDHCLIDFYIDFEFRSKFFQKTIGAVFNEAVRRMISAFEKRAGEIYGKS